MAYCITDLDTGLETVVATDKELMTTILRSVKTYDEDEGPLAVEIEDLGKGEDRRD